MRKTKIIVSLYGEVQGYPPTINMINVLAKNNFEVLLICRNSDGLEGIIDKNVEIFNIYNNISTQRQMSGSFFLKSKLYFSFFFKYLNLLKKKKPDITLIYDPFALAINYVSFYFVLKRNILWYHNHDVLDKFENKGLKTKILGLIEKNSFKKIDYFTLPSKERLTYFPIKNFKGKYFVIPNYPSLDFYNFFYTNRSFDFDHFNIVFQGSIGDGHGIEEIISILGWNEIINKNINLHLKGRISDDYKSNLTSLASYYGKQDYLIYHNYSPYSEVPELASKCQLGIAIFTKNDIMNRTLGTASNKIYEYAAVGTPILYFKDEHFEKYLLKYVWAFDSDLSIKNIISVISEINRNFKLYSQSAYKSFITENNFEHFAKLIITELQNVDITN